MRWSVLLAAVLALLLSLSAGLNAALFDRAKAYYKEANAVRLDPVGLNAFGSEALPTDSTLTRVVFTGDSRASGWPSPALEEYEFINRGISSQTSVQVLQRFAAHVAPLNPDVVILQVGINDIKTIGLFPKRRSAIIDTVEANIEQLVPVLNSWGQLSF